MADLVLFETGNGGDLNKTSNDLQITNGLFNQVYLALFGGNPEATNDPDTSDFLETQQRSDWWGNELLYPEQQNLHFNSSFERALNNTVLNSSGRLDLETAALEDLAFMRDFSDVSVEVQIIGVDKVKISVSLQEPGNLEQQEFQILWDGTKAETISDITI